MKKIRTFTLFILATFLVLNLSACDANININTNKQTEQRTISDFTEVTVSHGINLFLSQSDQIALRAQASPKYLKLLKTEVVGNTLKIYLDINERRNNDIDVDVHLSYKEITRLSGSSGVDIETVNQMKAESLKVSLSSGSDLTMQLTGHDVQFDLSSGSDAEVLFEGKVVNINASSGSDLEIKANGLDKLTVNISSGSDVELDGSAAELFAKASSGSDLDAFDFVVVNADVQASSASDLNITVVGELQANASSGGSINYKGRVKKPMVRTSGGGTVCNK